MFSPEFLHTGRRIHRARFISFIGSAFTEFAIPLFLLHKSGDARHVGLQWVFVALSRILGGYIAPRIHFFSSDRRALVWLDTILGCATLIPALAPHEWVVGACYLTTIITACLATIQGGFIDSLVGETAQTQSNPDAARAWLLGKIENGRHFGMLLGYLLAYLVSSKLGFESAFLIDAGSFMVSALLLSLVAVDGRIESPRVRVSYSVLVRPHVRVLTASQLLAGFSLYIYNALYVIVMKREFGASDAYLSALYILQYIGYFVGSRVPSKWVELRGHPLPDVTVGWFRLGAVLVYVGFAAASTPTTFIAINTVFSMIIGASLPGSMALFQKAVPRDLLRATGAARVAATSLAGAVGAASASFLLPYRPIHEIFLLGAAVYFASGSLLVARFRKPALAVVLALVAGSSVAASLPSQLKGADLAQKTGAAALDLKGDRPTVVVFMSAKCPCSRSHEKMVQALARDYGEVRFVGVHSNADEAEGMARSYFTKAEWSFPIVNDPQSKIADAFGALKTPHVFIVAADGKTLLYQGGLTDSHQANRAEKTYLKVALDSIRAGKKPDPVETRTLGCYIKRP